VGRRKGPSPGGLLLSVVAVMLITELIQAVAVAIGWGVLALGVAIYLVARRGRRRS
jgi:hypothetical protein